MGTGVIRGSKSHEVREGWRSNEVRSDKSRVTQCQTMTARDQFLERQSGNYDFVFFFFFLFVVVVVLHLVRKMDLP